MTIPRALLITLYSHLDEKKKTFYAHIQANWQWHSDHSWCLPFFTMNLVFFLFFVCFSLVSLWIDLYSKRFRFSFVISFEGGLRKFSWSVFFTYFTHALSYFSPLFFRVFLCSSVWINYFLSRSFVAFLFYITFISIIMIINYYYIF